MKNERALVERRNMPAPRIEPSGFSFLLLLALVALGTWFLMKNRQAVPLALNRYQNKEQWEVSYNPDGMPTKVVVHRNATRS